MLKRVATIRFLAFLTLIVLISAGPIGAQDMTYTQAPMLDDMVASGDLPPVADRLPANPLVVEPIESIGEYGGTWRRAFRGVADFHAADAR